MSLKINISIETMSLRVKYPNIESIAVEITAKDANHAQEVFRFIEDLSAWIKREVHSGAAPSERAPRENQPIQATSKQPQPAQPTGSGLTGLVLEVQQVKSKFPPYYQFQAQIRLDNGATEIAYIYPSEIEKLLGPGPAERLVGRWVSLEKKGQRNVVAAIVNGVENG
jgi:hypothetical protein